MCVIAYKPKGKTFNYADLSRMWDYNPDGAGVLVPGHKYPIKGIMQYEDLKTVIKAIGKRHSCAVHFRMATHGAVCADNTHPFPVGEGRFLMHNGVLTSYGSAGEGGHSDSKQLALDLTPLTSEAIRRVLNSIAGKYLFVDGNTVTMHGGFQAVQNIQYSNLHWDYVAQWDESGSTTRYEGRTYYQQSAQRLLAARTGAKSYDKGWHLGGDDEY